MNENLNFEGLPKSLDIGHDSHEVLEQDNVQNEIQKTDAYKSVLTEAKKKILKIYGEKIGLRNTAKPIGNFESNDYEEKMFDLYLKIDEMLEETERQERALIGLSNNQKIDPYSTNQNLN